MTLSDTNIQSITYTGTKGKSPAMYKVLLHNDDYTTMEFVIEILISVFGKSYENANQIMLEIHNTGKSICGIYTRDIAETKVKTVHSLAESNGFPLHSTMEEE